MFHDSVSFHPANPANTNANRGAEVLQRFEGPSADIRKTGVRWIHNRGIDFMVIAVGLIHPSKMEVIHAYESKLEISSDQKKDFTQ